MLLQRQRIGASDTLMELCIPDGQGASEHQQHLEAVKGDLLALDERIKNRRKAREQWSQLMTEQHALTMDQKVDDVEEPEVIPMSVGTQLECLATVHERIKERQARTAELRASLKEPVTDTTEFIDKVTFDLAARAEARTKHLAALRGRQGFFAASLLNGDVSNMGAWHDSMGLN